MRSIRVATLAAAVMVALAACGGSGGGDPTAVVKEAFALIEQGKFDQVGNLACAAKKAEVEESLNFAAGLADQMPGLDSQSIIDSMKITISGLDVKEESRSGDTATVKVSGTIKIAFDEAKMRELMKAYLEQLGQPVDDTMLDAAMSQMSGLLSFDQPLDETTTLVNEGGSWKICG